MKNETDETTRAAIEAGFAEYREKMEQHAQADMGKLVPLLRACFEYTFKWASAYERQNSLKEILLVAQLGCYCDELRVPVPCEVCRFIHDRGIRILGEEND